MTVTGGEFIEPGQRTVHVVANRVACWRIGWVDIDRCRECPYLLRLDVAGDPASGYLVCADSYHEAEVDIVW